MPARRSLNESPADREIVSARVFDATREAVFAAFLDPVRLAQWWGPNGFTNTFRRFEPRPGGRWEFTMRGPDGTEHHNECAFTEVVAPERVVFDHLEPTHRFRMTMDFAARGVRTELTWHMRFELADEAATLRGFIAAANEQNFDRLAAHLAATPLPQKAKSK